MKKRLPQRHLVLASLVALLTVGAASSYHELLRGADALIEMPCQLVSAIDSRPGASCYRLNWSMDPLDYINTFTDIEFDRTWLMNVQGQYSRSFTAGAIRYELVLATVGEREHYVVIQPVGGSTSDRSPPEPIENRALRPPGLPLDAEFIAGRLAYLFDGTTADCLDLVPHKGIEPSCAYLPMPSAEAMDHIEALIRSDDGLMWATEWSYNETLGRHLTVSQNADDGWIFFFLIADTGDGESHVAIQEESPW
jgi:hypothetical protein